MAKEKFKKINFCFLAACSLWLSALNPLSVKAQSASFPTISSGGGFYNGVFHSNCWTLGQLMNETNRTNNRILTQGFQQPFEKDLNLDNQNVSLNTGWNLISSYIQPHNPDIESMINEISGDILILKDVQGQAVIPSLNINAIGNWNALEGYKVKVSNDVVLTVSGMKLEPESTPIDLLAGWSIVSYLRDSLMDATTAFATITGDLLIAKNNQGQTYIPSLSINTIRDLVPGQGYKVKMANAATLTYPVNAFKTSAISTYQAPQEPVYYTYGINTGSNATIVVMKNSINGLNTGDEIGVFNKSGKLAGAAVYENRPLAITVWGDDVSTNYIIEGMRTNEAYHYKIWDHVTQLERNVTVSYERGERYYKDDGFSILKTKPPLTFGESQVMIYPNPSNGKFNMSIVLTQKENIRIRLMDIYGREVHTIVRNEVPRGKNMFLIDLNSIAAGLYLCEVHAGSLYAIRKLEKN